MSSVAEKPAADNPQPPLDPAAKAGRPPRSPRWRKETLLPEITQLALEGHTGQTIGRKLGLPKRTVNRWLHELRQEWAAKAAEGAGELFAVELARLDAIYREAMQAWRASQAEMEVRLVEDTSGARGDPKKKNSVRTQPPRRNAALLTRATAAVMASCRLKGRAAPRPVKPADPDEERTLCGLRIPKAGTIESDKWWLSNSLDGLWEMDLADLYETARRLRNVIEAEGGTFPAELEGDPMEMTAEERDAHCARLKAAIEAIDAADAGEESPPEAEIAPSTPENAPPAPVSSPAQPSSEQHDK